MLQTVLLVTVALATVAALAVFARGVVAIVRQVGVGRAPAGRLAPAGRRTLTLLKEVLGHGRFQHRPAVRLAHWVVMASFPLLFLTLVTGYGQLVDPGFALPLIGHWAPWEWLTEAVAWLGLAGIGWLILVRRRTRPDRREDLDVARRSRFFGSTRWQAYVVEGVILGVLLCVLALRALEHAWLSGGSADQAALATPLHFPPHRLARRAARRR
ncbi:hypothetical protein [Georgenia sp. SUBG003]|uniref:hypothetical protein n=1 Tax=Georgenia sp. SUBG003 TaxID=1497974 RepID=UPI003AB235CD